MKSIKILMIAVFSIFSMCVFAQQKTSSETKQTKGKASQLKYACPMHPEETADKPGKCSKCKMNLTEVKQYGCPMHAEITSDKPGKCSKCKMDLTEMKQAEKNYICPMHAEITSDKPGKCSKCKMDLVEKKDDHSGHNH